ncbi:MAG: bifunctional phosphopantothenoylcysteine decarboxylase/phosphopantothenate--cysteine ligase CoaBC [Eubacteriales bacterium]
MLSGKTIIVGVSGGIAAYKSAYVVSGLKKMGADVTVCMTEHAKAFVTPLTFESLAASPVLTDVFERGTPWEIEHISLAEKADAYIVAPATANIIAKLAGGIADDMLTTTFLAATCPKIIAPAMNTHMFENSATQANIEILKNRGVRVLDTDSGLLACGDIGAGRMKEPQEILDVVTKVLAPDIDFKGKSILISAGPTREYVDAVRYLSNPSSGKMGFALAENAAKRGASVTLVAGPVGIEAPKGVRVVNVVSAAEMAGAVEKEAEKADIVIMAAAVADYTPKVQFDHKIKKAGDMMLELVRTKDILSKLGKDKKDKILVGFAAETEDCEENAKAKLAVKNLDIIALNDIKEPGAGFGVNTNHITLFKKDGSKIELKKASKQEVAARMLDEIADLF